jgi:diaminopimelate epimerase
VNIRFWKVEAIKNDFPLVHLDEVAELAASRFVTIDFQLAELAVRMSDRHFGIGGDGLLALGRDDQRLRLRMFNPDGSEDFCGNGLRAAANHAFLQGWVANQFEIQHLDRNVPARIHEDGSISTALGQASYDPELVPTSLSYELYNQIVWDGIDAGMPLTFFGSALTTGSTHVVIPTASLPDDESFRAISPRIEIDGRYPKRTSIIWRQETSPNVLRIRIWERGVGETLGCGTGSSAAAADYARRKGLTNFEVSVENPGGAVTISGPGWEGPITVRGEAHEVYSGEFHL